MMILSVTKTSSRKIVHVTNIPEDRQVSDDLIAGFVMATQRETPGSLFGWTVKQYGADTVGYNHGAIVELHTD